MANAIPLLLLPPAARSTRTAPRPSLLTAGGRCDAGAVMRLAHELARDDVADAARRGRTRRYKVALRDALASAWITLTVADIALREMCFRHRLARLRRLRRAGRLDDAQAALDRLRQDFAL